MNQVRIEQKTLRDLTDGTKERNIYTHPNPLARDIFWQRLDGAYAYIEKHFNRNFKVLDFGGGSGVFSKALSHYFNAIDIIDLDVEEAEKIAAHFELKNVNIIQQNINDFHSDVEYDVIIATDVLEHFYDLNVPYQFFRKYLKKDGFLLVTLPTENWLYELGRKVVNKTKPIDHYHRSKEVIDFLKSNNFDVIKSTFAPRYLIPIPLFEIVLLKKNNNNNAFQTSETLEK